MSSLRHEFWGFGWVGGGVAATYASFAIRFFLPLYFPLAFPHLFSHQSKRFLFLFPLSPLRFPLPSRASLAGQTTFHFGITIFPFLLLGISFFQPLLFPNPTFNFSHLHLTSAPRHLEVQFLVMRRQPPLLPPSPPTTATLPPQHSQGTFNIFF